MSPTALSAEEQAFADRTIAAHSGIPGGCSASWSASRNIIRTNIFPPKSWNTSPRRPISRWRRSTAWSPSTRSSTWSPQGEHTICICRGTACHTRGSRNLLQRLRLELGLPEESEDGADKLCVTTPDRKYSLRTVACFGQCALAPVVEVDHAIFGHMNEQTLHREIEHLQKERKS